MLVHPDIVESQQWTTVTKRKSKGKAKASSSNVMGRVSLQERLKKISSPSQIQEKKSQPLLLTHAHLPRRRLDLASNT